MALLLCPSEGRNKAVCSNKIKLYKRTDYFSERTIELMANPKWKEWVTEEKLVLLEGWARNGLTDQQLAKNMGIGYSTLMTWKKEHQEIREALKKGKEVVDLIVENALFKKACGYTVTVKKPIKVKKVTYDKATGRKTKEVEEVVYADEEVVVPADTTAQIFWLKNRMPQAWRDKVEEKEIEDVNSGVIVIAPVLEKANE